MCLCVSHIEIKGGLRFYNVIMFQKVYQGYHRLPKACMSLHAVTIAKFCKVMQGYFKVTQSNT